MRGGQINTPSAFAGYQPHIDGIRAIAIVLVLLFHFDLGGATQGFLGVDIFFVISGFLVGGMIFRDLDRGQFSLLHFFRRRFARILPALILTGLLVLAVGFFVLFPDELVATAASVRAALMIMANRHFYLYQDYFGRGKLETHFLHSWSLSVEEQFYLAFPFVALALARFRRFRRFRVAILLSATIIGFSAYIHVQQSNVGAAFYYMPLRAWELLAGVTLAAAMQAPDTSVSIWAAITRSSFVALVLTVAPAFVSPLFPAVPIALWQIMCVAGAAMLIAAGRGERSGPATGLLQSAPLRFMGLISYSLYLVHWPVLTLSQTAKILPLTAVERGGLMLTSIALAAASWKWFEGPCRRRINEVQWADWKVIAAMLGLVAALVLLTTAIIRAQGFPDRLSAQAKGFLAQAKDYSPLRAKCHSDEVYNPIEPSSLCAIGAKTQTPHIAVWGDSHAAELSWELGQALGEREQALVQLSSSSCPPLLKVHVPEMPPCTGRNDQVLDYLARQRDLDTVILTAFYTGYKRVAPDVFMRGIVRTVDALGRAGKNVIIIGPLPRPSFKVPLGIARQLMQGRPRLVDSQPRDMHDAEMAHVWETLRRLGASGKATIIDPTEAFCDVRACRYRQAGNLLYFDDNHPSLVGVRRIVPAIIKHIPAQ